jgi:hypothetical protein
MDGLIRFDGLKASANADRPDTANTETFPSEQVISQLRHRLISPDFRDSVEIKIAILAEIVLACYQQLKAKRQL